MKFKTSSLSGLLLIVVGILLIAGSFFGVWYLGKSTNRTVQVAVAVATVQPLQQIAAGDVRMQPRPAGAIGRAGFFASTSGVVGQFARFGLVPGQIVRPAALAHSAATASGFGVALSQAAAASGKKLRAVALSIDAPHGFQLPQPGEYVDLIAVQSGKTAQAGILAAHVLVLSVLGSGGSTTPAAGALGGGTNSQPAAQQGIVVLALSSSRAMAMALAQVSGGIDMILEPLGATGIATAKLPTLSATRLFSLSPTPADATSKGGK